jgi:hypothetical protein
MHAVQDEGAYTILRLRVQPRASRNGIYLESDGRIRVTLMAAPVEGAANKALIEFIARSLQVAKGAVTLIGGEKSREKTLRIAGITGTEVISRFRGEHPR